METNSSLLKETMSNAAKQRIYFLYGDIVVSTIALTTGRRAFAIDEIAQAETRRIRPAWLGPLGALIEHYLLVLTRRDWSKVVALRRRNGYFVWKLTHAVESAIRDAAGLAVLPGWRWGHRSGSTREAKAALAESKAEMAAQQVASPNSSA